MKVAELTGPLLDYWVARAEGICLHDAPHTRECGNWGTDYTCTRCKQDAHSQPNVGSWHPSTNWAQGGPIIERELITVTPQCVPQGPADTLYWKAANVAFGVFDDPVGSERAPTYLGKTYLIAAMRAYVASKFGNEVDDLPTTKGNTNGN